ncbi:DUF3857 domain-containing transglutaminase family protein [Novosphingobium flavum]|uniref:DUF3857 domain-containing transglutaminase family protein n=1 Tax=Novosphingobium aerophilum TaxID=2839843 RepID=UPI001639FF4C|nr:DUF3857 domain-containing transglutaminase family protein [Novosphingobium aerophilum]MBC2661303.1 DUF3857 domain-containing transglutaminase family protein [Novosphingobium aerophilum]
MRTIETALAVGLALGFSNPVEAAGRNDLQPPVGNTVRYEPAPAWVIAAMPGTASATPPGAPFRVIYSDQQIRVGSDRIERHMAFRVRLLSSQALSLGALRLEWNPGSQDVSVNQVRVYREGEVIDVLAKNRFAVIQREQNLEASMLTCDLTAALQIPGLQVGDEIEFATTIRERDVAFRNRAYGLQPMAFAEGVGANRVRLVWDGTRVPHYRSTEDIPAGEVREREVIWRFDDPGKVLAIDGAPPRFNVRRLIEFSDFQTWREVSAEVFPLFAKAADGPLGPKIEAEITRIMAASDDPLARASLALRFVQEQIRYVYVGLNGANYRPTDVGVTWQNRFGDCKAKSVMLLAMLARMGIAGEIVLVQSQGGDVIPSRLPSPALFDHAIVRASIADRSYYLDATLDGDRILPLQEPTPYRAILPLRASGAELEQPPFRPSTRPGLIGTVDVDWRAGLDQPAKVTAQRIAMGQNGAVFHAQLAGLSPDQAERALRAYWANEDGWIDAQTVSWRYDEARSATIMSITGTTKPDWEGDDKTGHSQTTPYAGSYPPPLRKRPDDQMQSAPWINNYPNYRCFVANIRVPRPSNPKLTWDFTADPYDVQIGGVHYARRSELRDNILRTVKVSRTFQAELTAAEATKANAAIPDFNNLTGQLFETRAARQGKTAATTAKATIPLIEEVDWTADSTACSLSE